MRAIFMLFPVMQARWPAIAQTLPVLPDTLPDLRGFSGYDGASRQSWLCTWRGRVSGNSQSVDSKTPIGPFANVAELRWSSAGDVR